MIQTKISDFFNYESLLEIYETHICKSQVVGLDNVSPTQMQIDEHLKIVLKKFNRQNYKFTNYKEQLFSKGPNKAPRVVSIATARDRIVLKALQKYLIESLPDCKTPLAQNRIFGIQEVINNKQLSHFIRTDIQSFYDSVDHQKLIEIISKRIKSKKILSLIHNLIKAPTTSQKKSKNAIDRDKGIPQGLSVSNILAEIYMTKFDKVMSKSHGSAYFRYVDDVLILCNEADMDCIEGLLAEQHAMLDLTYHPIGNDISGKSSKGCIEKLSFDYLGYHFYQGNTKVRYDSILKFEAQIAKLFTEAKYRLARAKNPKSDTTKILKLLEWKINLRITGCIYKQQRRGWMFYFSQIQDTSQLKSLDETIEKLKIRFKFQLFQPPPQFKSLHKTFYETKCKSENQKYIPNFDLFTVREKRDFLSTYLFNANIDCMSDQEVESRFNRSIKENIKDLERDLKDFS